jgi:hypothetical protein
MLRDYATPNDLGDLGELDEYGRRRRRPVQQVRRIPFDYVATFVLTGEPGRRVQSLINISAEATFICTSIGYGAEEPKIYQTYLDRIQDIRNQKIKSIIDDANKNEVPPAAGGGGGTNGGSPGSSPANSGIFTGGGVFGTGVVLKDEVITKINDTITKDQIPGEEAIRSVIQNFRDALSFKYAIIDKGSGRELQNAPIHNLAGLGRLDGTRPFRELPVPYVFLANSTVLVEVTELVTLENSIIHIDFQGYKEFR